MKNRQFMYLVLGDIHLGHSRNTTEEIIENLKKYFITNHALFKKLDMIFLAGDIFEKLLVNSSKEYIAIMEWLITLALYCKKNDIKLRILEGTPSHDWRQAKVLATALSKLNIDIDFKYVTTLYIEKNIDLGMNILYVPDEYRHTSIETFKEVKKLLEENNLREVDICIMHGNFNYQLPIVLESSHNEMDYLSIVKYFISIAHIHTPSVNGRILAQGSFDRLKHNEEEKKGGMVMTLYRNGLMEHLFIENKHAKTFLTLNFHNRTLEDIQEELLNYTKKLRLGSFVRVQVDDRDNLKKILKPLKEKYKGLYIDVELSKESKLDLVTNVTKPITVESFAITKDNIKSLMLEELGKHKLSTKDLKIGMLELNNIIKEI